MVPIAQISLLLLTQGSGHNISDYLQGDLRDLSVVAKVVSVDVRELKKIKKDYAQNYTFDRSSVFFKDPFKLRVDSVVEDTTVSITYNGSRLKIKAPGITSKQDIDKDPARGETLMDLGVLVPSMFDGFFKARFVRVDRETGFPVFDINYVDPGEEARYRVWIDPTHKTIAKREWYNRYGTQLATFFYDHPQHINGAWIPSMITVKNVDNKVAGATRYESIKVNQGLSDSLFSVK